jgi:UDP-N-acetyl-D-glucosamine dehydrogenase
VAFKPNVRDARNSPAADIIALLGARGASVAYHDPHVPTFRDAAGTTLASVTLDDVLAADVVVVVTAHAAVDLDAVYERAALVVDTVNSSAGRAVRPRQVLRLGAGWSGDGAATGDAGSARPAGVSAGVPAATPATAGAATSGPPGSDD